MKIYLAGPVSGYSDLNEGAFRLASAQLRNKGHRVTVPHDFVPSYCEWEEAMSICMVHLRAGDYDCVAVLPGFTDSAGAMCEVALADLLGIPVEPVDWLVDPDGYADRMSYCVGQRRANDALEICTIKCGENAIYAGECGIKRRSGCMNNGYMDKLSEDEK